MKKSEAIRLLGGSIASAAKAIGVSYQAVSKWPDDLSPKIEDRVTAALARRQGEIAVPANNAADLLTKQGQAVIESLEKKPASGEG
ncbi:hypothetical protein [Bordetella bronchialis]|uniref:hypothetical protein n=1 Tax=Bordetella bronchialis TaxID=463025 RepID=UPI0009F4AEEF|nr:hypothetical protein [Bordetella bronchialis]